ncbi:MAG: UDP-N-acetylglucosamine 2-epimerase, partial [Candidatus Omnitrophica bacterium]|nr:UDP-N-acetylglucosamine 2-epimerase [Candidatus Omnitrophota bacterium]
AVIQDVLDLTNPTFKKMYRETYAFLITKLAWLWGFMFALLDVPLLQPAVLFARRVYNACNTQAFVKYLEEEQFDVIITTHFMPVEVVSALKRKGQVAVKLICVITDYDVHRIWLGDGVDMYCCACEVTKNRLIQFHVPKEKIAMTGIPTDEKFSHQQDISELKSKIGLASDRFTVLMATGSFGIGPIEEVLQELVEGFQVMVICGRNEALFNTLHPKFGTRAKIYQHVDNMDELMKASDAMVTKPGGLSISEALVTGLPLIFFHPIPGQETNNIAVLRMFDVGMATSSIKDIVTELRSLKDSVDLYQRKKEATLRLARPNAAREICGLIE